MNRQIAYVLIGLLCFVAVASFSQTQNETLQQKVIRLSTENKILQEENAKLREEIAKLQKQKATLKPYYKTADIERVCEKYPVCKNWAVERYQKDDLFYVTSIEIHNEKVLSFFGKKARGEVKTVLSAQCRESYPGPCFFKATVAYDGVAIVQ